MKIMRAALLLLLASGCGSSRGFEIDDAGFRIERIDAHAFTATYDSTNNVSKDDARRTLLFHSASKVIDQGDIYMAVEEIDVDSATDLTATKQNPNAPPPAPEDTKNPNPAIPGIPVDSYNAGVTVARHHRVTARITGYREAPAGVKVIAASEVMDRIRSGEVPQF